MLHFTKKRALVVGVVASLALAAGAYAYFTSTGTGSGSASVGTSTPWAVATTAHTGAPLTPAGPTQTVGYTVTNGSSGQQNLAQVAVSVANANGSAWTSGTCSASDFSLNGAAAGTTVNDADALGNLAAGAISPGSITIQMVDTGGNQDDCKGVTVPLYLSAS